MRVPTLAADETGLADWPAQRLAANHTTKKLIAAQNIFMTDAEFHDSNHERF